MFDTRLICQVVEWERRIEIGNENRKNNRPEVTPSFPIAIDRGQKGLQSKLAQFIKLRRVHNYSMHSSEPA